MAVIRKRVVDDLPKRQDGAIAVPFCAADRDRPAIGIEIRNDRMFGIAA